MHLYYDLVILEVAAHVNLMQVCVSGNFRR